MTLTLALEYSIRVLRGSDLKRGFEAMAGSWMVSRERAKRSLWVGVSSPEASQQGK